MSIHQTAKKIIEALLFSSNEPIALEKIHEIIQTFYQFSSTEILILLNELQESYNLEDKPIQLDIISSGYIFRTKPIYRPYIEQLKGQKKPEKLSIAAIEVLAIVSHKQPITKSTIDAIRGVDSGNVIHSLLEKDLLIQLGKEESLGRPMLYGASQKFLQHFGIKSFAELKELKNLSTNLEPV